ncbi:hypothetical protein MuYL_1279 [Mucilaginibacter xinganensis]|uniref:Uncharacterized protein n=1 Tax=Mucilaginibacter xinganensis TaxID=1234841 RepID=A0A223NTJ4_9SPHI|nr:hypothetical protein MuYL_1279 [Mucilaginibacter xinganensis]
MLSISHVRVFIKKTVFIAKCAFFGVETRLLIIPDSYFL